MPRPVGCHRKWTDGFSDDLGRAWYRRLVVLAACAMLLFVAGCSSEPDGGGAPGATHVPADSSPREVAVVEPSPQPAGAQPGKVETPVGPNEPPPDPTPVEQDPEPGPLKPPENPETPRNPPEEMPPEEKAEIPVPKLDSNVVLAPPKVVLSSGHQALCVVGVGDTMPPLTLPDIGGLSQPLTDLLGPKLTVVLFWRLDRPYAREQFERLEREVVGPFAGFGVNTVAINTGDPPAAVQAAGQQAGATFPSLIDADGAALATVGTNKLPRTYLLDAAGQILWFDLEYSESTRRQLKNAILWHLTGGPTAATRNKP